MLIYGKERHFKLTVGAMAKIARMCPDGQLKQLEKIFSGGSDADNMERAAQLIAAMSEGYEEAAAFEGAPEQNPLSIREILSLSPDQMALLQREAMAAFREGQKTEIETQDVKKNAP